MTAKRYIEVIATFSTDGIIKPKSVIYSGKEYQIQRVLDIRRMAATRSGGCGIRYVVIINGIEKHLFLEDAEANSVIGAKWFVE